MGERDLRLTFDPLTIEHLGSNMYSHLPNAVAELVANAYDADATKVDVRISGHAGSQTIKVSDNGHGMSWTDLNDKYLRIGRNRRDDPHGDRSEQGRRKVSGKKGLGKLALFGIGHEVRVQTTRLGSAEAAVVALDWDALRSQKRSEYKPVTSAEACPPDAQGTAVTVSRLTRKTPIDPKALASSLSRLFRYADEHMVLRVIGADRKEYPVSVDVRLDGIDKEFEWRIPDDITDDCLAALTEHGVTGRVVANKTPLRSHPRGVAVFTNGRFANEPEFFGAADSSYAYSYLTGAVTVDMLDDLQPDVIATDRRAVNWEHPEAVPVRDALKQMVEFIARDRRDRRAAKKKKDIDDLTGTDVDGWVGSIQGEAKEHVRTILNLATSDESDMSSQERSQVIESLNGIAPPFANLYWQGLHPWIKEAAQAKYEKGEFHDAVTQAWIRYTKKVVAAAGGEVDGEDKAVFGRVFGAMRDDPSRSPALLSITDTTIAAGESLRKNTVASLEEGQRELSVGVASAFRNPVSHEEAAVLDRTGLLTYRQALDALGVISLLCSRLEKAKRRRPADEQPPSN